MNHELGTIAETNANRPPALTADQINDMTTAELEAIEDHYYQWAVNYRDNKTLLVWNLITDGINAGHEGTLPTQSPWTTRTHRK